MLQKKSKHVFPDDWKKISDQEAIKHIEYLIEHYKEYEITRNGIDYVKVGSIDICKGVLVEEAFFIKNKMYVHSDNEKICVLLDILFKFCQQEAIKREQDRKLSKKDIAFLSAVAVLSVFLIIVAIGIREYAEKENIKKAKIENMVKQYERSLPNYNEYVLTQQQIQNYRDSLKQNMK